MASYRVITDDYPTSAPKGTIIHKASVDGDRNIIGYVSSSEAGSYSVAVKMEHAERVAEDTPETAGHLRMSRARFEEIVGKAQKALDALKEHKVELSEAARDTFKALSTPTHPKAERIAKAALIMTDLERVFHKIREDAKKEDATSASAVEVQENGVPVGDLNSRAPIWERNRALVRTGDVISFRSAGNLNVPWVGCVQEIKRGIIYVNVPLSTVSMFLSDIKIEFIERNGQELK